MARSGLLAPATRVFGLPQIERAAAAPAELLTGEIADLSRRELGFSQVLLLRDLLRAADRRFEDLQWRLVDLAGEARWDDAVRPGDLLRVGDRVVILYQDHGQDGVLDPEDLCLDYVRGPAVRRLDEVFRPVAENDGEMAVELAHLGD